MPKPNKQIIIDAIIKEIEQGKSYTAVMAVNGRKWQMPERTFNRYWKTANEQHLIKQEAIKKELAEVDKEAAINARKKAIMTAEERKEWLTKVVNGEILVTLKKPFWNPDLKKMQYVPVANPADITERLKASAELSKMEGDYAPTKVAQTDKDGNDIKPLSEQQVDEILELVNHLK